VTFLLPEAISLFFLNIRIRLGRLCALKFLLGGGLGLVLYYCNTTALFLIQLERGVTVYRRFFPRNADYRRMVPATIDLYMSLVFNKSLGIPPYLFPNLESNSGFLEDFSTYSGTIRVLGNSQNPALITKVSKPYQRKATLFSSIETCGISYHQDP